MLLPLLTATVASASPSPARTFHPGRGPELVELTADGRLARAATDGATRGGAATGPRVQPTGDVLVRIDDDASLAQVRDLAGVLAVDPLDPVGRVHRLRLAPDADPFALSRQLHARADVAWSHPDLVVELQPTTLPDDPYVADQWHLENTGANGLSVGEDVDAELAWAFSTGAGELVAIIDSGVDPDHPDLRVVPGYDYVDDDPDSSPGTDSSGPHGTACAGLAAAAGDNGQGVAGVAYDADVYSIRLIGGGTTLSDMYESFVEASDAGAAVLSNSWTFDTNCGTFSSFGTIEDALLYAEEEGRGGLGAVVVTSAGNGGCDISGDGFLAFYTVIGVAASNGRALRESYSSYGDHVDITAPAGGVLTTDISGDAGYGSYAGDADYWDGMSGTSASAPIVAGTVALMIAANPRITAGEVREVLCWTAEPIDIPGDAAGGSTYDQTGWSPYYGCGRVDAGAAVSAVANSAPQAPVVLSPATQAPVDRVLLRWEPAVDADGDWLEQVLRWSVDGGEVQVEAPTGDWLDLTGRVEVGQVVSWELAAVDAWGEGDAASGSFTVVEPAGPPSAELPVGCSSSPAPTRLGVLAVGLLAVLPGLRRRR